MCALKMQGKRHFGTRQAPFTLPSESAARWHLTEKRLNRARKEPRLQKCNPSWKLLTNEHGRLGAQAAGCKNEQFLLKTSNMQSANGERCLCRTRGKYALLSWSSSTKQTQTLAWTVPSVLTSQEPDLLAQNDTDSRLFRLCRLHLTSKWPTWRKKCFDVHAT